MRKNLFILVFLLSGFAVLALGSLFLGVSIEGYYYWYILFFWIVLVLMYKLSSSYSMVVALVFFVISSFAYLTSFKNLAEIVMRLSFIGWLIAIPQAIIEYKNKAK